MLCVFSAKASTSSSSFGVSVMALKSSGAGLYPFGCINGFCNTKLGYDPLD